MKAFPAQGTEAVGFFRRDTSGILIYVALARTGLAAAMAEFNRGVLRALVGVVDHALPSRA